MATTFKIPLDDAQDYPAAPYQPTPTAFSHRPKPTTIGVDVGFEEDRTLGFYHRKADTRHKFLENDRKVRMWGWVVGWWGGVRWVYATRVHVCSSSTHTHTYLCLDALAFLFLACPTLALFLQQGGLALRFGSLLCFGGCFSLFFLTLPLRLFLPSDHLLRSFLTRSTRLGFTCPFRRVLGSLVLLHHILVLVAKLSSEYHLEH